MHLDSGELEHLSPLELWNGFLMIVLSLFVLDIEGNLLNPYCLDFLLLSLFRYLPYFIKKNKRKEKII